jgi:phosphate transport system protein
LVGRSKVILVRELRVAFHQKLEELDHGVMQLFDLIAEDMSIATDGLLNGDAEVLKLVSERELAIDRMYEELERLGSEQLALQGPMATDLRLLVSVLRVVPELERSHDLVVMNAETATHSVDESLSRRTRTLVRQMSDTCCDMWKRVGTAWRDRDASVVDRLLDLDEEVDGLHAALIAELASGAMPLPVTMDMTMVARNYERLGAHAVNLGRRVVYLSGHELGE